MIETLLWNWFFAVIFSRSKRDHLFTYVFQVVKLNLSTNVKGRKNFLLNNKLFAFVQTILKKQGKGTKSNATDALTDDQVNFLYENNLHQVLEEATKYLHSDGIKL